MARKKDDRPLHEQLPPVTFTAMGAENKQQDQGNLIAAKQSPAFPVAGGLIAHCLTMRGQRVMLDYTKAGVGVRFEVDGVWMNVEPRDRESGDAMLAVLKKISNLNIQDRRSRQEGKFGAEFHAVKYVCTMTTQGVPTGERVLIRIDPKKPPFETIEDLGMRPKMREQLKELLDSKQGLGLLSTPPGNGLSTLWKIGLSTADRYVRDFVSLEDREHPEEELINVGQIFYDASEGQTPADILPRLLLKQPDVFVVPNLTNAASMKILCDQVNKNEKLVISRVPAREAVEALLKVLELKCAPDAFASAALFVLNGRLVRKLCEKCRQPFQPNPQLLQKLGIPAGRVQMLYREYQPPPPEQRVDEKGRPIEIEICDQCGGLGYRGRTSVFELLVVTDPIRDALKRQPTLENLRQLARASGHRNLQEEGILLVAQGVTSLTELQRVLKQ